jgi:hypothetical protein
MRCALLNLAMLLVLTAPGWAQSTTPAGGTDATTPAAQATPVVPLDPDRLGVSMARIRQGLRVSEAREQQNGTGLKLQFQVQVFGAAPRIDILQGFDIRKGAPTPFGAPTHSDFISQWTPLAYRSPPAPLSSLAGWALFKFVQRADKSRCEQEIAAYRAAVMAGQSVAAPRCSQ